MGQFDNNFLQDYSGVNAAGSAVQGFIKGMNDMDDRKMKKQEFDAKMKAMQTQADRDALTQQLEKSRDDRAKLDQQANLHDKGFDTDPSSGGLVPAVRNAREIGDIRLKSKEAGYNAQFDVNGNVTNATVDPASLKSQVAQAQIAKAGAQAGNYGAASDRKDNQDWEKFATAINNPSSRAQIGKYQSNIDKAGSLKQFEGTLGLQPGMTAPDNETREQRIARYNKANPSDLYEVAKAADQLISNASSTIYGTDHLMPKDMGIAAATIGQWLHNGAVPANSGEFIDKFMHMAERENKFYTKSRDRAVAGVSAGFSHLKGKDPDRWNDVLGEAGRSAGVSGQQEAAQGGGLLNRGLVPQGLAGTPGSQSQKPKTVIQNGHTYNLNPATGEYE